MTAVFIRILLRYIAGALATKGVFAPEFGDFLSNDPEILAAIQVGAAMVIAIATEFAYRLAKRWGWST